MRTIHPAIAAACLAVSATAGTVSYTIKGVTTTNFVETGDITTEFPVGTPWTLRVEWDNAAAPLGQTATQCQYRLTQLTLTFDGASGPWTTSSLANKPSFTLNYISGGLQDEIQFTSGWGPADHTNQTIENWQPYSVNLVLSDPTGTAIPALTPAPSIIDFTDWSPLVAKSYLKLYLNNAGNRYIVGEIKSVSSTFQPEISVQQPAGVELTDAKSPRNFGGVAVGKTSAARTFVIRNTGNGTLSGLKINKSGLHKAEFVAGPLSATTLAPGGRATFKVSFKPKAKGARSAKISIANNDANENPFDIPVSGTGK